jgi:hypothetical protein
MSHSIASVLCAGLLLALGARSVEFDESAPAAASQPRPAQAPVANRIVKIFVTMRDDAGKVLAKSSVRIEADDSPDIGVGADGAKLGLPAGRDAVIKVLFPGGNCSVTLNPKTIASGRVAIGVDHGTGLPRCAVEDAALVGKPAATSPSTPSGRADRTSGDIGLSGGLF